MIERTKRSSAGAMLLFLAVLAVLWASFLFIKSEQIPKGLTLLVALIIGVGGIWALFLSMNHLVEQLPPEKRNAILPYIFIAPALIVLGIYIVYPTIRTIYVSFFDYTRGSGAPKNFGFQNYRAILTDSKFLVAVRNNILWLLFVPTLSVSIGLVIAVLVDRIKWEKVAKSLIFLPMAISFVGASVIWRFIYYRATWGNQIGLLNAIVTAFGKDPVGWLRLEPWNNFFLIIIMVWLQTGYAMVILSSAVKNVPSSLLEAARLDGGGELLIFFKVIIPYISTTILTVTTTITIMVLKIFDVVFVMTSGQFNTDVLANMMYTQMFRAGQYGRGAAIAVILFVAIVPVMWRNVRSMSS